MSINKTSNVSCFKVNSFYANEIMLRIFYSRQKDEEVAEIFFSKDFRMFTCPFKLRFEEVFAA